jgi:hypothetical protein
MLTRLTLVLTITSLAIGCHLSAASSPSDEFAKSFARVTINATTGSKAPIPLSKGLTIVNLFDEFSTGCPTGNRFESMERLSSSEQSVTILLIFSEKHFSVQDLENFKAILPMRESFLRGDVDAISTYLTNGKLLVVLDPNGTVIWHERPDMSEQQVMSTVSELIHSASK